MFCIVGHVDRHAAGSRDLRHLRIDGGGIRRGNDQRRTI